MREGGRIIAAAAIIAVAVNTDERREIIGFCVGPSEAETFWTEFLRSLKARGLDGLKLVISDAHTGLKATVRRVFDATWQRCRVHWMRKALAHVPKGQHTVVSAAFRQAFNQPDQKGAVDVWRHVVDQLRPRWPKLAALMDESEGDVLAYMAFPAQHRTKLHSTNPLERLNKVVTFVVTGFILISTSIWAQDERQTLRCAIRHGCSMGVDSGHPFTKAQSQSRINLHKLATIKYVQTESSRRDNTE